METLNEERKHTEDGRLYVVLQGGQLAKAEISAEQIKRDVELLEEVYQFIKEKCQLSGLLRQVSPGDQLLLDSFSDASSYSAICASQRRVPLFSDDGLLRIPLRNSYEVTGFSSQALVRHAAAQGKLEQNELYDAQLDLLKLQYRYILVNDKFLIYAFKRSDYSPGAEFDLVLQEASRREVAVESMAVAAGNFFKDLWLTPLPTLSKSLALHSVLAAITQHHHPRKTVLLLLTYLRGEMNLVPHLYVDIQRQASQWLKIAHSKDAA